jgi:membrane protein DedA with SNARE-associated domain
MVEWVSDVMADFGYAGVAALMFLENIFPPIPSEVVMPLAGFTAARGDLSLGGVVFAGVLGSLAGTLPWYWLGRMYDAERLKRLADRHGKWIAVSRRDIERADRWFDRYGKAAVLVGRLIPGVRTLISLPAGVSGMPLVPFLVYSALGTVAWTSLLAYLGYVLEQNWQVIGHYVDPIGKGVLGLLVLYVVVRLLRGGLDLRRRRRQR